MNNDIKTKRLNIRVSKEEYEILQKKAKQNNMLISCYVREKMFFDIPHIEKYSFEYKVLKGISYSIGALRVITEDKKQEVMKEVKRIMEINGVKVD